MKTEKRKNHLWCKNYKKEIKSDHKLVLKKSSSQQSGRLQSWKGTTKLLSTLIWWTYQSFVGIRIDILWSVLWDSIITFNVVSATPFESWGDAKIPRLRICINFSSWLAGYLRVQSNGCRGQWGAFQIYGRRVYSRRNRRAVEYSVLRLVRQALKFFLAREVLRHIDLFYVSDTKFA